MLESRNEAILGGSPAPRSAIADTNNINRLESELIEIKNMLNHINIKKNEKPMTDYLEEINEESGWLDEKHKKSMTGSLE